MFTSRITSCGISKSVCNALRPAGSWDMYGETLDSSKALRLDVWYTLNLVRSHLGYATQVWTLQSIDLIWKLKHVQRRATKYILDLPFICDQTYGDTLMNLNLLPISYWHEFLDMIFFFKVVTGTVRVSPSVLPQVLVTRSTRSDSNRNVTHFISRKCRTVTFQKSFLTHLPLNRP